MLPTRLLILLLAAVATLAAAEPTAPSDTASASAAAPRPPLIEPPRPDQPMPGFAEARPLLERALTARGREDLARHAGLPLIAIDARLDEALGGVAGELTLTLRNDGAAPLADFGLQTLASSPVYHGAGIALGRITVDGVDAGARKDVHGDGSAWLVALPAPLAPGAVATVTLSWTTTLSATSGNHGLDRVGKGFACLYSWYPELALRDADGWRLPPVAEHGDPTRTALAHVIARLAMRPGLQLACGGTVVDDQAGSDGSRVATIASPFTRNLAVFVAERLERREREVDGVAVVSWSKPGNEVAGVVALDSAADSLRFFAARLGHYPFAEFDAVEAPLGMGVGGMEATGLVLLDDAAYAALVGDDGGVATLPRFMLELVTAHEVAHQWFYGLVGSDAWRDPWLDESLTNWAGCWFLEQRRPAAMAAGAFGMCLMEASPQSHLQMSATREAGAYGLMAYGGVIYGRGALMYQALRRELGEEAFLAFLRAWALENRYGWGEPREWRAALDAAMGAGRAEAFIRRWLEGEGLAMKDLVQASRLLPAREDPPAAP